MDGFNGESEPQRWGGRIGEWVGIGSGGTEISIRRVRSKSPEPWWNRAEEWVRRWPMVAVATALFIGLILGLRSSD